MTKQITTNQNNPASKTECNGQALLFPELISRKTVTVDFQGGQISSDGGSVLLGRLDRAYGFFTRLDWTKTGYSQIVILLRRQADFWALPVDN